MILALRIAEHNTKGGDDIFNITMLGTVEYKPAN